MNCSTLRLVTDACSSRGAKSHLLASRVSSVVTRKKKSSNMKNKDAQFVACMGIALSWSAIDSALAWHGDLEGSDAMIDLIMNLLHPTDDLAVAVTEVTSEAGCGDFDDYLGNGSGHAEHWVCEGNQAIAPMTRMFSDEVCNESSCYAYQPNHPPQGVAIALDAITLLRNDGTIRKDSCLSLVGDSTETLRLLYSGVDGSGSAAACNAKERRDLVANFASLFSDCGGSECPGGLFHAFRTGDSSGTTSVFKDLVGIFLQRRSEQRPRSHTTVLQRQ